MNCQSSKVILKKLQRIENINKYTYNLIIQISKGATVVRPVYKVPDKKTVVNVLDELVIVLTKLNVNFAISNDAPRRGKIGTIITIKTFVKHGEHKTKTPKIKGGTESRNEREFNFSKENLFKTI
jgi:hypothetical protein